MFSQELSLFIEFLQLCQILTHKKRHPLYGCRKLLDDMQFVAVTDIQGVKTFQLFFRLRLLPISPYLFLFFFRERQRPSVILIDPIKDLVQCEAFPQLVEPEETFRSGRANGGILQNLTIFGVCLDLISSLLHLPEELFSSY